MRTLYLDCFSGIAGDMFLGALLDMGLDEEAFRSQLERLGLSGYELTVSHGRQNGFMGTSVRVRTLSEGHVHRGLHEIEDMISGSSLSDRVKERSLEAFRLLAEAEGAVHGVSPEEVHFHEVGAIDSIVDIVGAMILLDSLGVDRVCASPVNVGCGTVTCAHGVLPVPAPATARLLEGVPVYSRGEPMERTTPTGATLLRLLVDSFGEIPTGVMTRWGYGFGERQSDIPNMLRACVFEEMGDKKGLPYSVGRVAVLETNIDDMNPQDYQELEERLFTAGALDVFLTPIMMKKMRPAVRLTCIALLDDRELLGEMILRHSSSIGVRWSVVNRMALRRRVEPFMSSFGQVNMKYSSWDDEVLRVSPEYEDLRRLARKENMPLYDLRQQVMSEFFAQRERKDV